MLILFYLYYVLGCAVDRGIIGRIEGIGDSLLQRHGLTFRAGCHLCVVIHGLHGLRAPSFHKRLYRHRDLTS